MKNFFSKIWLSLKERARKFMVALKRNPQLIPMVALLVSFIILSFNLTDISNTTATLNKRWMGLFAFISMLFSLLSMVCLLNAFPKRKKPNIPVIILLLIMFAGIIAVDILYYNAIGEAICSCNLSECICEGDNLIKITEKNYFIIDAQYTMIYHVISMAITFILVVFEPLFAILLKKVNTSIDIEDNGEVGEIDISDED